MPVKDRKVLVPIVIRCDDETCVPCTHLSWSGKSCLKFERTLTQDKKTGAAKRCKACLDAEVKRR